METQGAHIDFSHVSVEFDDGAELLTACRDVSFSVESGQAVALIGPSGCGKSTTLRMASGLLDPSEGTVLVNGEPVGKPRQATALIPQDLGLFPWKTVMQNAALGLVIRKVPKADAYRRAQRALEQVGLAGFERAYPKELSGGMRQRLALARALAMDADLLLMDEPLSAIDALLRESLQDTLLDLWQQRHHTQMLVTHSIEEAVFLGQRILVFSARPGTVTADIANPGMGAAEWRDTHAFAEKCLEVRRALAGDSVAEKGEDRGTFPSSAPDEGNVPPSEFAHDGGCASAPESAPTVDGNALSFFNSAAERGERS